MNSIQFSVLSYYPSIICDENINVGLLFFNEDTGDRYFYVLKNTRRLENFDDELDMKFMLTYLNGMKSDWEGNLFGGDNNKSVESFIYNYENELRFGGVQYSKVDDPKSFIDETIKMYFRFDYPVEERPSEDSVKRYIKNLLRSNSIKYSVKSVDGGFEERVSYDFVVNNYGFKSFIVDENTDLQRQYMNLKGWAYTAQKNKESNGLETIFILDSNRADAGFLTARKILESGATIMSSKDVVPFVQTLVC